ncbi:hypothetical protein CERZMDRAFT_90396 [Cercospora zeae-maydis SCOH1-5]|uniref:Uncharacterized protein n=1 Tax=Cercospora zeae-maydis SCOH1-5 TaxID=717836 RepID=A0A6A6FKG6_9PEZI|nr:hypothetical protein CERZMDRAFT_90396 [Cercospora zeae-maydis SCOH1-5]
MSIGSLVVSKASLDLRDQGTNGPDMFLRSRSLGTLAQNRPITKYHETGTISYR